MANDYALILAGGGGTRLWPASRRKRPKQLLTLGGSQTLLAQAHKRASDLCGLENTLVVTASEQAQLIQEALPTLPEANLIAEPAPRNTAAAVALGALAVERRAGVAARFAVLPSDAFISDNEGFRSCATEALTFAQEAIVTIGICPDKPETGYGYLQPGPAQATGARPVVAFHEKPDKQTALDYVKKGYLWNAGMFFTSTGHFFSQVDQHLPALSETCAALRKIGTVTDEAAQLYKRLPAISIDYGIMEKAENVLVVPSRFGWDDVGSWAALSAIRAADDQGNVNVGDVTLVNVNNSVAYADPDAPVIAMTDVDGLVVVATKEAVLVTRRDCAQNVRAVVDAFAENGRNHLL